MAEPKIEVVVLDLFDTIVKWDPERLPLIQWQGREIRTTAPWFLGRLQEAMGERFNHERTLATYFDVLQELNEIREREAIEITCHERFIRVLERLSFGSGDEIVELAAELTRIHMAGVRRVTWAPPERIRALHEIAPHYRMAVLSNFDDTETGYQIIEDTGAAHLFEAVIISAEMGLRKPHPEIFRRTIEMLKVENPRSVLFVGDTPRFDIAGPHRAGMRTVWVSENKEPLTADIPTPDFIIGNISELPALLRTIG
jgi:HAD superfamily hydrolase (TIGR01549 family)